MENDNKEESIIQQVDQELREYIIIGRGGNNTFNSTPINTRYSDGESSRHSSNSGGSWNKRIRTDSETSCTSSESESFIAVGTSMGRPSDISDYTESSDDDDKRSTEEEEFESEEELVFDLQQYITGDENTKIS